MTCIFHSLVSISNYTNFMDISDNAPDFVSNSDKEYYNNKSDKHTDYKSITY